MIAPTPLPEPRAFTTHATRRQRWGCEGVGTKVTGVQDGWAPEPQASKTSKNGAESNCTHSERAGLMEHDGCMRTYCAACIEFMQQQISTHGRCMFDRHFLSLRCGGARALNSKAPGGQNLHTHQATLTMGRPCTANSRWASEASQLGGWGPLARPPVRLTTQGATPTPHLVREAAVWRRSPGSVAPRNNIT